MVLVLSTTPCFAEDKCFDEISETSNSEHQNDDDCNKSCCSPFFNCNTCAGFTINTFYYSISHFVKQPEKKSNLITTTAVSDFLASIWQPPKIILIF